MDFYPTIHAKPKKYDDNFLFFFVFCGGMMNEYTELNEKVFRYTTLK